MSTHPEELASLCHQFSIDILYVFGSRADEIRRWLAGDQVINISSDVDIGIRLIAGINISILDKVKIAQELEELFDVPRVDLVFISEVDPFLAANIIRGERLYARDDYQADEYDLYILRRAGDLAPLERERMAMILGEDQ